VVLILPLCARALQVAKGRPGLPSYNEASGGEGEDDVHPHEHAHAHARRASVVDGGGGGTGRGGGGAGASTSAAVTARVAMSGASSARLDTTAVGGCSSVCAEPQKFSCTSWLFKLKSAAP
jgi:hypothetical protein